MIITVASGKGGTGKTTIATSLAQSLSDQRVLFLDCDVEAPNAHLFLYPVLDDVKETSLLIPNVDLTRCSGHQRCAQVCQYHAIVYVGGEPLVFPELCHGCGSCTLNCPEGAIGEHPHRLGTLEKGYAGQDLLFARGLLQVGEPMAVPVIRQLKQWLSGEPADVVIRDAPPGTSCPVVESMRGSDYVLLVSEPTPFGLHDLELAHQMVAELQIPAGVIINRDGIGDQQVEAFCNQNSIPILMRIPMRREIAVALAAGQSLVAAFPHYRERFRELFHQILEISGERAGVM